jgi:hypothetical protein
MYIAIDLVMNQKTEEQVEDYRFGMVRRVGRFNLDGSSSPDGEILVWQPTTISYLDAQRDRLLSGLIGCYTGNDISKVLTDMEVDLDSTVS